MLDMLRTFPPRWRWQGRSGETSFRQHENERREGHSFNNREDIQSLSLPPCVRIGHFCAAAAVLLVPRPAPLFHFAPGGAPRGRVRVGASVQLAVVTLSHVA